MFDQAEFNDVNSQEHSFQLGNYEGQAGKNLNNRWGADMNQARRNVLPEDDGVNAVAAAEYAVEDFAAAANSNYISSEAGSTDASTAKNRTLSPILMEVGSLPQRRIHPRRTLMRSTISSINLLMLLMLLMERSRGLPEPSSQ